MRWLFAIRALTKISIIAMKAYLKIVFKVSFDEFMHQLLSVEQPGHITVVCNVISHNPLWSKASLVNDAAKVNKGKVWFRSSSSGAFLLLCHGHVVKVFHSVIVELLHEHLLPLGSSQFISRKPSGSKHDLKVFGTGISNVIQKPW